MHSTLPSPTEPASTEVEPRPEPFPRLLGWLYLVGGLLGTAAAFALTVEKIALLRNDSYVPSCSLNPILNCGSIMRTEQAELFGFPNPLIGLVAFPVVVVTGALLVGRVRLPRWYWLGLQVGTTLGVVFVGWLVFQSLYRINALCPYCMVVWAVVVPVFWYTTLANLASGRLGDGARASGATGFVLRNHGVLLSGVLVVVLSLVATRFWDYWSSLLG
jgi:uncharacterized membrane protein